MINIIALNCPRCNAPLKLLADADQTVCQYCSTPLVVLRDDGGKPVLMRMEAAADQVEAAAQDIVGVGGRLKSDLNTILSTNERIAAELAIQRLTLDHDELQESVRSYWIPPKPSTSTWLSLAVTAVVTFICAIGAFVGNSASFGILWLLFTILFIGMAVASRYEMDRQREIYQGSMQTLNQRYQQLADVEAKIREEKAKLQVN